MKLADYGAVGRAGAEAREGRDAAARLCAAPEVLRQVCVTPRRAGGGPADEIACWVYGAAPGELARAGTRML